jgi:branched-chain amino acid aminotransferase
MPEIVNLNGTIVKASEAKVSVFDHGFLFGDSIYETMRTFRGRIFLVERHMQRLQNSARMLRLQLPLSVEKIREELDRTVTEGGNIESYIRLIVTRGKGRINLDPDAVEGSNYVIIVLPFNPLPAEYYEKGIQLALVTTRRNDQQSLNPGMKTSNLLNNVLAFMEAKDAKAFEGILQNLSGYITEGTGSNIFLVAGGRLITPSLDSGLLPGVTRGLVLELARKERIPVEETNVLPEMLIGCDECFITGTTKGVLPVRQIDNQPLSPAPGPITKRLMQAYREFIDNT